MRRRAGDLRGISGWRAPLLAALAGLIAAGCAEGARPPVAGSAAVVDPAGAALEEWRSLYRAKDYFRLRESLRAAPAGGPAGRLFYLAAVEQAFNQPRRSNATLARLFDAPGKIERDLLSDAWATRLRNYLRLTDYKQALVAADTLLSLAQAGAVDRDGMEDVENVRRVLVALGTTPPQTVAAHGAALVLFEGNRQGGRWVPVVVAGERRALIFDTGANFSVLMRSEAQALGLEIRPAGLEVATSTDAEVKADVAVVERLVLGATELRNVVFLVMPDELLSFPDGFRIPGILGLPVIEALGEVRWRGDEALEIPEEPTGSGEPNLALHGNSLLVRLRHAGENLLCQLDTGAERTVLYEPYYRRNRKAVERAGRGLTVKATGVGGTRDIPAVRLPEMSLDLGGRPAPLRDVDVYTKPIREEDANYLDCNVGMDLLRQFGEYSIDFRSMTLSLR